MASSILNSDDGVISGTSGLKSTGGDDGVLVFQSKGTETARINTDSQIVAAAGTASLPALTTTGDVNTGIFFPAADTIAFAEGGAEAMRIDSSGRVGIGTSSPNSQLDITNTTGNTGLELHRNFSGDVVGATNSGGLDFTLTDTDTSNQTVARINAQGEAGTGDAFGGIMRFYTSNTSGSPSERLRIDASGNVGIGTTSPLGKLEVRGSGNTDIYLNTGNNSGDNNRVFFGDTASATVGYLAYDHGTNAMSFGINGSERARINSSGNVGIGTTSPAKRLQINSSDITDGVRLFSADASGEGLSIEWMSAFGPNRITADIESDASGGGGSFAIRVADTSAALQTRLSIDNSGNLQFNSGYGSAATAYGCRAWVNFNGQGSVSIRASGNVSSISDNGTGYYTVNFSTSMPNTNYSTVSSVARDNTGSNAFSRMRGDNYSTGGVGITVQDVGNNQIDPLICAVSVFR